MATTKNYIDEKADILSHFGLTKKSEVKEYLRSKTADCKTAAQREIRCDIIARTLLDNFYDGDRTFVKQPPVQPVSPQNNIIDILREKTRRHEVVYERFVIRAIGKKGIKALMEEGLIKPYDTENGLAYDFER